MDPITREHDELFGTVVMAARLGRAGKIIDRLRQRYEKQSEDPLAGLPYALAILAEHQSSLQGRDQLNYPEVIETLSDLLFYRPDHWLGRYLRVHTRALLPVDATEHRGYITAERDRATEDVAELLDRQSATSWQPWFACSYLLAARLAWESAEPDRLPGLVAAATSRPATPIGFRALGGLLCESFAWYSSQPELPGRQDVDALRGALFPQLVGAAAAQPGGSR